MYIAIASLSQQTSLRVTLPNYTTLLRQPHVFNFPISSHNRALALIPR